MSNEERARRAAEHLNRAMMKEACTMDDLAEIAAIILSEFADAPASAEGECLCSPPAGPESDCPVHGKEEYRRRPASAERERAFDFRAVAERLAKALDQVAVNINPDLCWCLVAPKGDSHIRLCREARAALQAFERAKEGAK